MKSNGIGSYQFQIKNQDLKLMHLMMYMKSILARFLKNLNNVKSCTLLNGSTLNSNHKMDSINFI
jgi:hypothetical protein